MNEKKKKRGYDTPGYARGEGLVYIARGIWESADWIQQTEPSHVSREGESQKLVGREAKRPKRAPKGKRTHSQNGWVI